jgi:hypothetical protein
VTPTEAPEASGAVSVTELGRLAELLGTTPADLAALAARLRTSMSFPGGCVDVAGTFRSDVVAAAELVDEVAALLGPADLDTPSPPAVVR